VNVLKCEVAETRVRDTFILSHLFTHWHTLTSLRRQPVRAAATAFAAVKYCRMKTEVRGNLHIGRLM
jgi:hypothetical protein